MRPVLADALRSEPEIAATLRTVFAGACAVEASMTDVSESGWVATLQFVDLQWCVYVDVALAKRCGISLTASSGSEALVCHLGLTKAMAWPSVCHLLGGC